MYHLLRRFGIDDDHIILFLADSYACDPRNPYPGAIYNNANVNERNWDEEDSFNWASHTDKDHESNNNNNHENGMMSYWLPYYAERRQRLAALKNKKWEIRKEVNPTNPPVAGEDVKQSNGNVGYETLHADAENLYGCSAHVDYSGDDVDIRKFLEVLQGRHDGNTPLTRRLMSDSNSHILIYLAGHGARSVLKFQDSEFLSSTDLAETFGMMHEQGRYRKIVFLADTCHAIALCEHITAPNILCLASSNEDEESYSHHLEPRLGVQTISQWMYEAERMLADAHCNISIEEERFAQIEEENMQNKVNHNNNNNNDDVLYRSRKAAYDIKSENAISKHNSALSAPTPVANTFTPSILHQSWFEYNYSPERQRKSGLGPYSNPAYRSAVNDNTSIHTWKVSEFMCASPPELTKVVIKNDLL